MAYFEGNAAGFDWVSSVTASSNYFFDNIGIIFTQGTLVVKNSNVVQLSNN